MIALDFHGTQAALEVADAEAAAELAADFGYFRAPSVAAGALRLTVRVGRPDAPRGKAFWRARGWRAVDDGAVRVVDYRGRAVARWDYERRRGEIVAESSALARELAHLALLSRVGEELDARGLHRVHALGVSYRGRGALLLLGSGGGKSSIAIEALKRTGLELLSDDTPLLSRGELLPFPLRIGLRDADLARGLPADRLGAFPRRERTTKTVVSVDFFRERVPSRAGLSALVIGRPGGAAALRPLRNGRAAALAALLDALVVGRGVAQMCEYVLRPRPAAARLWTGIAASRFLEAWRASRDVPAYALSLGAAPAAAARELARLLGAPA